MSWLNQPYQGSQQQQQQQQPQYNGQLQPQPTGYGGQMAYQQSAPYQQQQPTGYGQMRPQATGYPQQQVPMATGYQQQYQGFAAPQQNQSTGYRPPMPPMPLLPGLGNQNQFISAFQPAQNLQTNSFMPPSQMQFAAPQLNQQPSYLAQTPAMQNPVGQETISIPWALSADEKKKYDSIFRNWDTTGEGFIGGLVAKEVFGQAGLEKDDLMDIWNLADVNDRGKLNIDEFHVAMGLIYRKLNGIPIPATLPPELAPPSSRDLNDSVGFLTNLLKNDKNTRATSDNFANIGGQGSYAKQRSLHDTSQPSKKDATVYRHNDSEATTYKSSSRHIDRDDIRYSGSDSPNSELEDVKKSLQNTRSLVEKSRDRDDEEEELRDELRDLKRRIERVHDDLEYNLRSGRRTAAKDDEKRKLERDLLNLEHEELPRLSRRMEEKERDKKRDKAKFALERDSRNNDSDRYSDRPRASRDDYDSRDAERSTQRGSYDEDSRVERETSRSQQREPPTVVRANPPAPPPPPPPVQSIPVPPSAPKPSPVVMSAEERTAHRQAEASRRVQERLRALGLAAPSSSTPDTSVADRLEQDRKEAAAKAAQADKDATARGLERDAKLEKERTRGVADERNVENLPVPPTVETKLTSVALSTPSLEEVAFAERELALEKEKESRQARLRQLEKELAEAQEAEENFIKNKAKFATDKKAAPKIPPPPPATRSRPATTTIISSPASTSTPVLPAAPSLSSPPVTSIPPTDIVTSPSILSPGKTSTNPFRRADGAPTPITAPPTNPFFRIGAAAIASLPIVGPILVGSESTTTPAPAIVKKIIAPVSDDDWDVPKETEGSDSSDDEGIGNRNARQGLASALFGGLISAPARPTSAQSSTTPQSSIPAIPRTFAAPVDDTPIVRPMAFLGAIQGGMKLKKTETKDRSTPSSAGAVIGDASAPVSTYVSPPSPPLLASPTPVSEPVEEEADTEPVDSKTKNRESVDWYGALASDAVVREAQHLPSQQEEAEPQEQESSASESMLEADSLEAVDLTKTQRSRSLYVYQGQREEDLSFEENVIILAHPAKDVTSPWWYGTIATTGLKGWVPASFIESIENGEKAKALYDYSATSVDELSFTEGSSLLILSSIDESWWSAEKGNQIGLVPKSYVELFSSKPTFPSISDDIEDDYSSEDDDDREAERSRVLEAAGLVVRESNSPIRPRRAAPEAPIGSNQASTVTTRSARSPSLVEEDAYSIWQRVMRELPPLPLATDSLELKPVNSKASAINEASPRISGSGSTSAFLNRLAIGMSREKSAKTLSVSSPIVLGSLDERRASTAGISTTWSSLIDPSALIDIEEKERKRQEAIFELILTETTFSNSLQLIQNHFLPALQGILSEKALSVVFANVEDLLLFSILLCSEMEERQKSSRLYILEIGDIIFDRVRGLAVFKRYCVNHSNASKTLVELKFSDPALRELLDSLKINGLELESFLLEPIQRLARIPLLLTQILRYTDDDHSDQELLQKSLIISERILVETNEAIRTNENFIRIQELSDCLQVEGSEGTLDLTTNGRMGKRLLLKEGDAQKVKSKKKLNLYLFNDLLLLTEYRAGDREVVYRYPIPLEECSIKSSRDDSTFSVTHRSDSIQLRVSSSRQCKVWKEEIERARMLCLEILGVYKG